MIYGYSVNQLNIYGLLELREVTFDATSEDLREIAAFLVQMADSIDSGELAPGSHRHLRTINKSWHTRHPGNDVIVSVPDSG